LNEESYLVKLDDELKQELYDVYDKDQKYHQYYYLTWKKKKVQLMVFQELNGLMIIGD
jgi:hypothetical protein